MKIVLNKGRDWYYTLVAKNGQILLVSEGYYSKWNAKRQAMKLVRANGFEYEEKQAINKH